MERLPTLTGTGPAVGLRCARSALHLRLDLGAGALQAASEHGWGFESYKLGVLGHVRGSVLGAEDVTHLLVSQSGVDACWWVPEGVVQTLVCLICPQQICPMHDRPRHTTTGSHPTARPCLRRCLTARPATTLGAPASALRCLRSTPGAWSARAAGAGTGAEGLQECGLKGQEANGLRLFLGGRHAALLDTELRATACEC